MRFLKTRCSYINIDSIVQITYQLVYCVVPEVKFIAVTHSKNLEIISFERDTIKDVEDFSQNFLNSLIYKIISTKEQIIDVDEIVAMSI